MGKNPYVLYYEIKPLSVYYCNLLELKGWLILLGLAVQMQSKKIISACNSGISQITEGKNVEAQRNR